MGRLDNDYVYHTVLAAIRGIVHIKKDLCMYLHTHFHTRETSVYVLR